MEFKKVVEKKLFDLIGGLWEYFLYKYVLMEMFWIILLVRILNLYSFV